MANIPTNEEKHRLTVGKRTWPHARYDGCKLKGRVAVKEGEYRVAPMHHYHYPQKILAESEPERYRLRTFLDGEDWLDSRVQREED